MSTVNQPYTNQQLDALLRACVSYSETFQEDIFYAGNIAGRGGVPADTLVVRRMLEWLAGQPEGLIENCGFGEDNITYFRLGAAAKSSVAATNPTSLPSRQASQTLGAAVAEGTLFLSLSGGGLRATLFHLGMVLFLSSSARLGRVRGMVSVSGGSILAAHLVDRWQEATQSEEGFARVAADLVAFSRTDIRHTVFVPWLWSRLVPLNWMRRSQSRTARLRAAYDKHFHAQTLGGLDDDTRPFLAIVATDSIKQERIAFTPKGILRFPIIGSKGSGPARDTPAEGTLASGVPLSLAVAASSCFPPVFPRMTLTNHDLGLNYEDFKDTLSVNDGGVTDNLGLEVLLQLKAKGHDLGERILVSNVERPLRDKPGDGPLADQAAQAAALSEAAEARIQTAFGGDCYFVRISGRPASPVGLAFQLQTRLAVFRTDLDAPSWQEIQALLLHGFSCAASVLAPGEFSSLDPEGSRAQVAAILRFAGCQESLIEPVEDDLRSSHARPMSRLAVHAALVLSMVVALAGGSYTAWARSSSRTESLVTALPALPAPNLTPPVPIQSMSEIQFLPDIDYRPFEISTFDISVDMRPWKPFTAAERGQKTSPVIFTRKLVGIKKQPVDQIRIYGATEGTGIDAACTSGQPFWIEHSLGQGNPRTVQMHKYHVVVDISSVPVNSRFEIEVRMTMWNGLKEDDPWLAFVAFTDIPQFRVQVVFPERRPYMTRKFVKYPSQQDQEMSAEGDFKQLELPQRDRIYWEIKPAIKDTTYELQWTW